MFILKRKSKPPLAGKPIVRFKNTKEMDREAQLIIENLDFTGSKASWFDYWSTNLDWDGEGNLSPEKRKHSLKLLIQFFNEAKHRLKKFPKEYQLWMEISEKDSALDAICIHTVNPNKTAFPILLDGKAPKIKSEVIAKFIETNKLSIAEVNKEGNKIIIAYDSKIGIPPVK